MLKRYYPHDDRPWLWAILFGPVYFLVKDAKTVARTEFAALITAGAIAGPWYARGLAFALVWSAYALFARDLLRKSRKEEKRLLNGKGNSDIPISIRTHTPNGAAGEGRGSER